MTEDGGHLAVTLQEMKVAVVEVTDNVSQLVALFADLQDAADFIAMRSHRLQEY